MGSENWARECIEDFFFFFFCLSGSVERKWSKGVGKTTVDVTEHEIYNGKASEERRLLIEKENNERGGQRSILVKSNGSWDT